MVYNPETLIRLRDAVGPMVGMNLDPSHLMWMGGDPVTAVHKLGADRIYHVHAKDVRLERNYVGPDGVLDTKTIDQFAKRTWNYVALGHGHDVSWWKEFLSCLSMEGLRRPDQPGNGGSDHAGADRTQEVHRCTQGSNAL